MEAINVLTLKRGILESNVLFTGGDAVKKSEKAFKDEIIRLNGKTSDEDLENHLDDGYFDDNSGNEVLISWPEVRKS